MNPIGQNIPVIYLHLEGTSDHIIWDFLLKSENGPILDFKNPEFRSHKTWSYT